MRAAVPIAIALATSGCQPKDGAKGEAPPLTWEADIAPVFGRAACAACHTDGDRDDDGKPDDVDGDGVADLVPTPPFLDVDPLEAVLGVASNQTFEMALVEPSDHLYSYLWHKINGSQSLAGGSGTSMPLGGTLTESDIELVATWIDEGASP